MPGNRLAVNILSLTTAQIIVKLINVVVSIAVVRYLGTDELGRYAYVLAFAYPFGALADFGLGTFAIREMSRNPARESELFRTLQRALVGLAGLGWVTLMGAGAALHYRDSILLVSLGLAGAANVLSAVTTPLLAVLTSREELHRVAVYQVLASLLGSIAIVAALAGGGTTVALLFAATIANLCMWAVAYALVRRLPERVPIAAGPVFRMIREAAPFGLLLIAFALYYRVDMLILQWLRDAREVGLYAAAYRFLDISIPLAASLGRPFYPRFSSLAEGESGSITRILDVSWQVLLALGLPVTVMFFMTADLLVALLFGPEFGEAGGLLRILVWGGLPLFMIAIPVQALMARNRVFHLAAVYGASTVLNILLNLAMIPRWGAAGAAVATVCCEWFNLGLVMLMVGREFPFKIAWGRLWRYGAAAAGMVATVWWLQRHNLGLQAGAGGAVYLLTLAVLNRFHFQEVADLKRLLAH